MFNLALARLQCGTELDGRFNVQLHVQDVDVRRGPEGITAAWRGKEVRVLHFSGPGRDKYPECKGLFARVADPLPAGRDGIRTRSSSAPSGPGSAGTARPR